MELFLYQKHTIWSFLTGNYISCGLKMRMGFFWGLKTESFCRNEKTWSLGSIFFKHEGFGDGRLFMIDSTGWRGLFRLLSRRYGYHRVELAEHLGAGYRSLVGGLVGGGEVYFHFCLGMTIIMRKIIKNY